MGTWLMWQGQIDIGIACWGQCVTSLEHLSSVLGIGPAKRHAITQHYHTQVQLRNLVLTMATQELTSSLLLVRT